VRLPKYIFGLNGVQYLSVFLTAGGWRDSQWSGSERCDSKHQSGQVIEKVVYALHILNRLATSLVQVRCLLSANKDLFYFMLSFTGTLGCCGEVEMVVDG
jgi:hypothetical protein